MSNIPSPPSAIGKQQGLRQSGKIVLIPSITALPASSEVRQPLKESMAIIALFILSVL